ncbi:MAG: crossover junction endodeoxyribonuclease RuvC [Dehalococcoidales bacterium]|nr:crossover junction endodeoxyribonuclease RuvC [Dehalococcoidales bacterium]
MKVLGIDPGTIVAGYGIVDNTNGNLKMVVCGVVKSSPRLPPPERLCNLFKGLSEVVARYKPDAVAVETPFVSNNVSTALAIGRAQAITILVAAIKKIPIYEYTPAEVKHRVTSYGASSKEQIQRMVKLQLNLSEIPQPSDAADALAVALCHISETHMNDLIEEKPKRSRK